MEPGKICICLLHFPNDLICELCVKDTIHNKIININMFYTEFAVLQLFGFLGLSPWEPNSCNTTKSLYNIYK